MQSGVIDKGDNLPEHLRKGEISQELRGMLSSGIIFAIFAILGIAAFALISFLSSPFLVTLLINAWFAGSVVYLAGLGYGIINDLIGCRVNLPYFSLGHQPGQRSVIESNDPNAVGIAWGILATFPLALIAAALFSVTILIMGAFGCSLAMFTIPLTVSFIPFVIAGAHWFANKQKKSRLDSCIWLPLPLHGLDSYQGDRLRHWLKSNDDVNNWYSNSDRNVFGFIAMPVVGVIGLAATITCSIIAKSLPAILFSWIFSVIVPVAVGGVLALGLITACSYLYFNHNKQVDNKYKLDFHSEKAEDMTLQTNPEQVLKPSYTLTSSHGQVAQELSLTVPSGSSKNSEPDKEVGNTVQEPEKTPAIPSYLSVIPTQTAKGKTVDIGGAPASSLIRVNEHKSP